MSEALSCAPSASSTVTPSWITDGGFVLLFYSIVAMFWGIIFVCEEFGVPSITAFCKRHRISDSLAGSIFIGTGLSLPVFFISVVGMFIDNAAIGIGAVVGGNLFNHLVTVGTSIYVSPNRTMKLDPVVYTRESLIYLLTCILIIWAIEGDRLPHKLTHAFSSSEWDNCLSISWLRSFTLILVYIAYCIFDANFYLLENCVQSYFRTKAVVVSSNSSILEVEDSAVELSHQCTISTAKTITHEHLHLGVNEMMGDNDIEQNDYIEKYGEDQNARIRALQDELDSKKMNLAVAKSMLDSAFDETDKYRDMFVVPQSSWYFQVLFYITFPVRYLIYCTVPDIRRPGSEERINMAIAMVIVWLAILSYVLTVSLTVLGNWWHIDGAVMGFTIAAWASNFPAHWSSMVVSKHGFGDVSCCNCLGSNIFNNLIGLGLPWWIYSLWKQQAPYNALQDSGVFISILLMIFMIFIQYPMVAYSNWTLSMWMMPVLMLLYFASIGYLCYFSIAMNPSIPSE